jgi:hypothetical protein
MNWMNFWKSKLFFIVLSPKHYIRMGYKYKINHNYFDLIDTEYKAYILGFIYADGCIQHPKGKQMNMRISIQEEDGYILDKLSKDAAGNYLRNKQPPSHIKAGYKPQVSVYICSTLLCFRLIKLGCKIRKSKEGMTFPKLQPELIKHFIRGFMDGDGSVIIKKQSYNYVRKTTTPLKINHKQRYKLRLAFCSTDKKFLLDISKHLNLKKIYITEKLKTQITYILWIENKEDVKNSIDYLYKDCNFFLKRKYNKIIEFNMTIKSEAEDTFSERLETT